MNERVVDIVEEYLAAKVNGEAIPDKQVRQRIKRTRVPEDEIDTIFLKMLDEWDREQLNQIVLKKAKRKVFIGGLGSLCISIIVLASILFSFLPNGISIFTYGLMTYGFVTAILGYSQIKKSKMVKSRREIKWRDYDN